MRPWLSLKAAQQAGGKRRNRRTSGRDGNNPNTAGQRRRDRLQESRELRLVRPVSRLLSFLVQAGAGPKETFGGQRGMPETLTWNKSSGWVNKGKAEEEELD